MLRTVPRWSRALAILAGCAAVLILAATARADSKPTAAQKPKVEVVFCLDTTGSMGGLIQGAKQKIWSISNQIANGKPTPDLKIGLVAYRDKGDVYITKVFDLTDDLDAVHGHLKEFKAEGGGDTPESVNQGLDDAVNKITWSSDAKTLRIVFLVGDAPPHMDYKDDVKYPETCKKAVLKGIIINTLQCGTDPECTKYWKDICVKAEGSYVNIAQDGGTVAAIPTEYDQRLAEINTELARTTLTYGDRRRQDADNAKKDEAARLPMSAAAERAGYNAKAAQAASYDLLDNIKRGNLKLKDLKDDELPAELQKMTAREREEYLDKLGKRREELRKECLDLDRKRSDTIAKKQAEQREQNKAGFDNQVLEILRQQAKKYNVEY
jgi:Mg-chelatase subunit ChlD